MMWMLFAFAFGIHAVLCSTPYTQERTVRFSDDARYNRRQNVDAAFHEDNEISCQRFHFKSNPFLLGFTTEELLIKKDVDLRIYLCDSIQMKIQIERSRQLTVTLPFSSVNVEEFRYTVRLKPFESLYDSHEMDAVLPLADENEKVFWKSLPQDVLARNSFWQVEVRGNPAGLE
jgi:hypothetical protein